MELSDITPLILTFNEEDNIFDTLDRLRWAKRVVIVDSYSTDKTLEIISCFSNAEVFHRPFDHFADQCNFGLEKINTSWVLSIDADYKCSAEFVQELANLQPAQDSYSATFRYCVYGKPLTRTLYPPRTILYRVENARYVRDGHAHRVRLDGKSGRLREPVFHDDWKPLSRWLKAQSRYATDEADKLLSTPNAELGWKDRIRLKILFAPLLTFVYCLFFRYLVLDGWAGMFYTMQRVYAELILSMELVERKLKKNSTNRRSQSF